MNTKLKEFFNIPNLLCYLRILMIPLFVWTYLNARTPVAFYLAAGILFLSGITDFLDGYIARHFHMVTEWGKLIDPLADKLTQAAVAVTLSLRIPLMSLLFVVFFIKEITMGVTTIVLFRSGKKLDGALWYGKVCTAIFYGAMFLIIALPMMPTYLVNLLICISSGFLIFAFVMYMLVFSRMIRK